MSKKPQSVKVSIDTLIELVEAKKSADGAAYEANQREIEDQKAQYRASLYAFVADLSRYVSTWGAMPENVGFSFGYSETEWRSKLHQNTVASTRDPAPAHDKVLRLLKAAEDLTLSVALDSDLAAYI